jgi:hypothetical protein
MSMLWNDIYSTIVIVMLVVTLRFFQSFLIAILHRDLRNDFFFFRQFTFSNLCLDCFSPFLFETYSLSSFDFYFFFGLLYFFEAFIFYLFFTFISHFAQIAIWYAIKLFNLSRWSINLFCKGPFNNYVRRQDDRGEEGLKKSLLVHVYGIETVHVVVEWPPTGILKLQRICSL